MKINVNDIKKIVDGYADYIKKVCPIDTGNLRASIKVRKVKNELAYKIYVNWGGNPYVRDYPWGKAPYMPFTNEPWISPFWNGRKNPNEGWWDNACEHVINDFAKMTGGKLNVNRNRIQKSNRKLTK